MEGLNRVRRMFFSNLSYERNWHPEIVTLNIVFLFVKYITTLEAVVEPTLHALLEKKTK